MNILVGRLIFKELCWAHLVLRGKAGQYKEEVDTIGISIRSQIKGWGVGPGLMEFMKSGNVLPYSPKELDIDTFSKMLAAIWTK